MMEDMLNLTLSSSPTEVMSLMLIHIELDLWNPVLLLLTLTNLQYKVNTEFQTKDPQFSQFKNQIKRITQNYLTMEKEVFS